MLLGGRLRRAFSASKSQVAAWKVSRGCRSVLLFRGFSHLFMVHWYDFHNMWKNDSLLHLTSLRTRIWILWRHMCQLCSSCWCCTRVTVLLHSHYVTCSHFALHLSSESHSYVFIVEWKHIWLGNRCLYVPGSWLLILGMVIPPFKGKPYNG